MILGGTYGHNCVIGGKVEARMSEYVNMVSADGIDTMASQSDVPSIMNACKASSYHACMEHAYAPSIIST